MTPEIEAILDQYRRLLGEVDEWFARCSNKAAELVACRSGCSGCCRGLFDITLLDAALLKSAFDRLDAPVRESILKKGAPLLESLQVWWPGFADPYILNELPQDEWTQMKGDDPCLLLNEEGYCLLYEARPMTCRLHGLPHVDISGEIFEEDFCSLNFHGTDPLVLSELRWEFRRLFERELALFRKFTSDLLGRPRNECDTFIPTALFINFRRIKPL